MASKTTDKDLSLRCIAVVLGVFMAGGVLADDSSAPAQEELMNMMDMSLDDLMNLEVQTVSRVSEKLDEAPGTVYVITREDIKKRGYSSLKDALQVIPGFNVFHRDLDFVGAVRGLAANDNEKFTLMINGVEMNQVNEPDFLNGPINLDSVERIEVIVGPSSIFKPANTLVATINVITKEVKGLEAVASTGTDLDYGVTLMGGHAWSEKDKVSVVGTLERRKGFDSWSATRSVSPMNAFAGTENTGKSYHPNYFIVAKARHGEWSGQVVFHESTFPELRLGSSTPESLHTSYRDDMKGGSLKHEHVVSETLTTTASLSSVYKKSVRSTATAPWQFVQQVDHNGELGLLYTGWQGHTVQLGLQGVFEDNKQNGEAFFDSDGSSKQAFYNKNTWGLGAYLDDSVQVNEQLKLVGGIRGDYNTLLGEDTSIKWGGRAAAIYAVHEGWTTKIMYNRAIRMPSPLAALNEIWGIDAPSPPSWAAGAPNAEKPEILQTFEWTNIFYLEKTRVSLTGYYQMLDHFITWGSPHTNVGDYSGWGLEWDIKHHLTENVTPWINGTYIDSKFDTYPSFDAVVNAGDAHRAIDPDKRLIGAPGLTANTGLDWNLTEKMTFTTQVRYWTDQPVEITLDGSSTNTYFSHVNNQFYVDTTLLLKDVNGKGMDIRIAGKNILDNRDFVAGPWIIGQYRPRGATLEVSAYMPF